MEWTPEPYDLAKAPTLQSTFRLAPDPKLAGNFPRVAKWSPDGSVLLSQCENRTFQMFNLESSAGGERQSSPSPSTGYSPDKVFPQAAPVLDFIWYPTASPNDPASFCFVASVRECPVKLLDASDGRLRASYRIVDHRERQIAPHSLAFNLTAQRLYCGFEDAIEIFDLSRPGEGRRMHTTPSKKSKDGLKGIVSALAFSRSYSADESFYAAGTFTPTQNNIAMFSDAQDEPLMYLGGGPRAGVTQLQFNTMKPHILYASYRGSASGSIYSWDVRSNVDSPLEILRVPGNPSPKPNQKMRFDVDLAGRVLSVGDQLGNISVFELDGSSEGDDPTVLEDLAIRLPKLQFKAHADAVGSVAFHPFKPTLLSAAGSRHFTDTDEDVVQLTVDDFPESEPESDDGPLRRRHIVRQIRRSQPVAFDSVIRTWNFPTR